MNAHRRLLLPATFRFTVGGGLGAQDTTAKKLPPVVTVTRDVGRSPLDLPYAISSLRPDSIAPGQTHMFIEQTLSLLPGVTVANRTNPSQDTRISDSRIWRALTVRSAEHSHHARRYAAHAPRRTNAPIDYLDLESVGTVEVIRGTASALYGNASGGVIDLHSIDAPDSPFSVQGRSWAGSGNLRRNVALFGGDADGVSYEGNVGHTESDGNRQFSQQRLTNVFGRSSTTLGGTTFSLIGLGLDMPVADNPGAITRAQVDADPSAGRFTIGAKKVLAKRSIRFRSACRRAVRC